MKKILILFICFELIILPAFCLGKSDEIVDEFVENTLDKNLKIKNFEMPTIVDEFAQNNNKKNAALKPKEVFEEELPSAPNGKISEKKQVVINEEDFYPIKIRIKSELSTKAENIDEGDYIEFETIEKVKINDKVYPEFSIIKARVETISKNKARGVPADLTVGNFSLDNNILAGEINKTGANRSLWVYPASCAGNIFFGAGLLLLFIRGGHAKIKPAETYTIYLKR